MSEDSAERRGVNYVSGRIRYLERRVGRLDEALFAQNDSDRPAMAVVRKGTSDARNSRR